MRLELAKIIDKPAGVLRTTVRYQKDLNVLYLNVPKAGCTTIKRFLFEAAGGAGYRNWKQFDRSATGSFSFRRDELLETDDKTFIFTVLRNPYARIFSAYWDKVCMGGSSGARKLGAVVEEFGEYGEVTFAKFLEFLASMKDKDRDPHFRSMSFQTHFAELRCDYYGCLEDRETIVKLRRILNRDGTLENRNSRNSRRALEALNRERNAVHDIYRDDFDNFGYSSALGDIDLPPAIVKSNGC